MPLLLLPINNHPPHNFLSTGHVSLTGYQLYAVENWIVARTVPVTLLVVYTGNPDHSIRVDVWEPHTDDDWSNAMFALRRDGARPKETEHGTIMATSLAHFRSDFTIVHIPKGDFLAVRDQLYANINLRRMRCSGRSALTLEEPSDTTKDRFLAMYHLPELSFPTLDPAVRRVKTKDSKHVFAATVLELVKVVQAALQVFGLAEEAGDGLLCDVTVQGLSRWMDTVGEPSGHPLDPAASPAVVAALLSSLLAIRNRLAALGYSHVPKDPFLHPLLFRVALGAYLVSTTVTPASPLASHPSPSTWTLPGVAHNLPLPTRNNSHLRSLSSNSIPLAPPAAHTAPSLPAPGSATPAPPLTLDLLRAIEASYDAKLTPPESGSPPTDRRTGLLTGLGRSLGGGIGSVALNIHSLGRGLGLPLPLHLGGASGTGAGAASVLVATSDMALFVETVKRGAWGASQGHNRRRSSDGVVTVRRKRGKRRVRGDEDEGTWTGDEGDVDGEGRLGSTLALLGRPSEDRGRVKSSPSKPASGERDRRKTRAKDKDQKSRSAERPEALHALDDAVVELGMVRGLDGVAGSVRGLWSGRVLGVVWLREAIENAARDRDRDVAENSTGKDWEKGGKSGKDKEKDRDKAKEKEKGRVKLKEKEKGREKDTGKDKKEKTGRWRERWTLGVASDGDVDERDGERERARSLDQVRDDEHYDEHLDEPDHTYPDHPPPLSDDDAWPRRHRPGSISSGFSGWSGVQRKIGSWTNRHIPDSIKSKRTSGDGGARKGKSISRLTEIVASGSRQTSPEPGTGHDRRGTAGTGSSASPHPHALDTSQRRRPTMRVQQSPTLRPLVYGGDDEEFLSSGQVSPVSDILDPDAFQHHRFGTPGTGKGSTRSGTAAFLDPVAASSALTLFLGSSSNLANSQAGAGGERELTPHERKVQALIGLGHPTKRPWGNRIPPQHRIASWSDPLSARDAAHEGSDSSSDGAKDVQMEDGVVSGNDVKSDVASGVDGEGSVSVRYLSRRRKRRSGGKPGQQASADVISDLDADGVGQDADAESGSDPEHDVLRMPRRRGLGHDAKRRRSLHDLAAYRDVRVLDIERMRIDVDLCKSTSISIFFRRLIGFSQIFTDQLSTTNATLRSSYHTHQSALSALMTHTPILAAVDASVANADQARHETRMLQYEAEQQLRVAELRHNAGLPRTKVLELREAVFGGGGRRLAPGVHGAHGRFNRVQWTLDGRERLVDAHGRTESEAEEEEALADPLVGEESGVRVEDVDDVDATREAGEDDGDEDVVEHPAIKPMWLLRFFTNWGTNWGAAASASASIPPATGGGKPGDTVKDRQLVQEEKEKSEGVKSARSSVEPELEEPSQLSPISVSSTGSSS
ncbi:hypothetical protein HGRIS_010009 [Hohenbuehelia grisea]|uniref:STB6-like N-terminal domain-containing protein n=1 Tax=Hohenbuehelia grisea TaxID=104357 RepID=A0ABR3J2Z3_9AGAR